jgi:mono/diheme cytochrome c family protein
MTKRVGSAVAMMAACCAVTAVGAPSAPAKVEANGLLQTYCGDCHNSTDWAGGLAIDTLEPADMPADAEHWEKAIRKMRTGLMPPAGEPRLPPAQLAKVLRSLETQRDSAAAIAPAFATKPIHRLNRSEYANAIRDLIGYEVNVSTLLPADDAAEGFDNIAEALGSSPTLVQAYVSAAMKISRAAIGDPTTPPSTRNVKLPSGARQTEHVPGLPAGSRGGMFFTHEFPLDAEYEFRVEAREGNGIGGPAGGPMPRIDVLIDGRLLVIENARRFQIPVSAGRHEIGVTFVEKLNWEGVDDLYSRARPPRLTLDGVTIKGPFAAKGVGDTPSRKAIFGCYPKVPAEEADCARKVITRIASSAFRRPLSGTDPEVETLMRVYSREAATSGFEVGVQHSLAQILSSARFLYRMEEPTSTATASRVSDLELASRLSFFLWSSIPDDRLLSLAAAGELSKPSVLSGEVRRMLADARSRALVENFAGQWLHLRELGGAQPIDAAFDAQLRDAFAQETQLLFEELITKDRSIVELIDAKHTYLNERLAKHYGIAGVRGEYMRRVELPADSPRRGLLGQGSILTVTSAGNRTSPVMRGSWVLETLMGAPPPRPPPGVEADLKEDPAGVRPTSVRERLEQHRASPACASCHQIMDPLGFALENFDLLGRWRETDGAAKVDSTAVLLDGTKVSGPADIRQFLMANKESFVTSAAEKMLTYAMGRRVEASDQPMLRKIVRESGKSDYRFSSLVLGIVTSPTFQSRAGS